MSELPVAGVLPGPVADDVVILATSEDDVTRWAGDFDAPDANTAAMAYEHCRRPRLDLTAHGAQPPGCAPWRSTARSCSSPTSACAAAPPPCAAT
nr:hypothetical protein OG781_04405 [Streptomyces sp. NBC_00830]